MSRKPEEIDAEDSSRWWSGSAAIDVAKASGKVCTRVPHPHIAGRRVTRVWDVGATTNAIMALAEQLARQGIERVMVESTSDYWRPFVYLLEAHGLSVLAGQRPRGEERAGPPEDRQAGCGVAGAS